MGSHNLRWKLCIVNSVILWPLNISPLMESRGQTRLVPYPSDIKLQSLRSVRFSTSLVRNTISLGSADASNVRYDTSNGPENKTNKQWNFDCDVYSNNILQTYCNQSLYKVILPITVTMFSATWISSIILHQMHSKIPAFSPSSYPVKKGMKY